MQSPQWGGALVCADLTMQLDSLPAKSLGNFFRWEKAWLCETRTAAAFRLVSRTKASEFPVLSFFLQWWMGDGS